jgi:hypothetical protein
MNIVQLGEIGQNGGQFVMKGLLGKLDFAHVELTDTRNLVLLVDYSWRLSLGFRQDDVDKIL